jgi:hypothetical protein
MCFLTHSVLVLPFDTPALVSILIGATIIAIVVLKGQAIRVGVEALISRVANVQCFLFA